MQEQNEVLTPAVAISLTTKDTKAALKFYKQAFGAIELYRFETPGGGIAHAEFNIRGTKLYISDEAEEFKAFAIPEGQMASCLFTISSDDPVTRTMPRQSPQEQLPFLNPKPNFMEHAVLLFLILLATAGDFPRSWSTSPRKKSNNGPRNFSGNKAPDRCLTSTFCRVSRHNQALQLNRSQHPPPEAPRQACLAKPAKDVSRYSLFRSRPVSPMVCTT